MEGLPGEVTHGLSGERSWASSRPPTRDGAAWRRGTLCFRLQSFRIEVPCDNSCDNSWPIGGIHGHSWSVSGSVADHWKSQSRRSSLKERGRVKALVTSDLGCFRPRRTRRNGRRGQGSGGARPRSGRRALRLAPGSTNNVGGGDSSGAVPQKSEWVGGALVKAGVPAGGQARVGCRSSLRRGRGRHDGVRGALAGGVNQRGDHARCWGS